MGWRNGWAARWFKQNVSEPLLAVMQRGADPKTLALSGALGITMGIFPIYGVTALMCACTIAILGSRCNAPTIMLANVLATPLELSLVVPFLRLGEFVVGGDHFELSKDSLWKAVTFQASQDVLLGLYHAFLGWLIASPFITGALYAAFLPMMALLVKRYASERGDVYGHLTPLMKYPSP